MMMNSSEKKGPIESERLGRAREREREREREKDAIEGPSML